MATSMKRSYLFRTLTAAGSILAVFAFWQSGPPDRITASRVALRPAFRSDLGGPPPEVREFLDRVLARLPEDSSEVKGYQFHHWKWGDKPTHEAVGVKAIRGVDPEKLIARILDVDSYEGNIAHVEDCRSEPDVADGPPGRVRFYQAVRVPGVARVQQSLELVDAGTVQGYRVAYWYLLKDRTESLDTEGGARNEFNVGAWFAAPGVVGYALSSWPRRGDVNALQWASLTIGADSLAVRIVEGNIDGMAVWAMK